MNQDEAEEMATLLMNEERDKSSMLRRIISLRDNPPQLIRVILFGAGSYIVCSYIGGALFGNGIPAFIAGTLGSALTMTATAPR